MGYDVEETIKLNKLFDIYQELLTKKQREYFDYYFLRDYSLSEIAEIYDVSRNAVHLQIKNIIKNLEDLENKLKVLEKNSGMTDLIDELKKEQHKLSPRLKTLIKKVEKVI